MMGYGYSMMGGWSGMMIIPIILIAAVIYLVFNQEKSKNFNINKSSDNSLNILNERFARGEISEDEYNRIKSTLNYK
ncbi:SHOCT domain-containing protein [Clostridium saccharoperbutylacetonicum]|jgi:putative membrane protein